MMFCFLLNFLLDGHCIWYAYLSVKKPSLRFASDSLVSFHFMGLDAAAAKSLKSCPTLCDPRDGSPPGSPVPGILQARTLEWIAISFSNA